MPKCLECGFEAPRLQWTHFRYKCSGRFSSSAEYSKEYPNAKLVDDDLAKKTAVTLTNLVTKYGEEEGVRRWDTYRAKQAASNSLEYKKEKHGWTEEKFDEFNKSRSQTLGRMISRHGEEEGTLRWMRYCERQAFTNSERYFIQQYGLAGGAQRFREINALKRGANDPAVIAKKLGMSLDEAVELVCKRRQLTYTSKLELSFVVDLESLLGEKLEHSNTTSPFGKWDKNASCYYVYDIKHHDCIIEFNGDYWHANPRKYSATDVIRGTQASSIWEKDARKMRLVEDLGFRTMVVWEHDYRENPVEVYKGVIKWMRNGQK